MNKPILLYYIVKDSCTQPTATTHNNIWAVWDLLKSGGRLLTILSKEIVIAICFISVLKHVDAYPLVNPYYTSEEKWLVPNISA